MSRSRRCWSALPAALLLASCGGGIESSRSEETLPVAVPEARPIDSRPYSVVFAAPVGEGSELFGLDPTSGERTQITSLGGYNEFPVWSPVGDRVVFLGVQGETPALMMLDLVTGETSKEIDEYSEMADWGPAAERLLIMRGGDDGGLFLRDVVTGEEERVETGSNADAYPRWARRAPVIAYESSRDGNPEIYVTWLETGETTRLTENQHLDEWPSPSPDGSRIAWASGTEEDKNLWIMQSDGSGKRQLTESLLFGDAFPEWAPDGDRILLTVNDGEQFVLKLVDIYTGETTDLGPGSGASWRRP